ncbi:MAG TPA: ABC transporter ATP-binding protein [Candidatus Lokiarchaeia archaeon]|nr:ABC transporter ATP-binding protein [Candidatus Lokiarchaeia archaeon]
MIDIENLTKNYGTLTAVDNLTLHVDEGEVFGFLGPNGAGKTTTVRMLCCIIAKTSGSAQVGGFDIGNKADQKKIRQIIGLLPENPGLYDDLSAYKNLDFFGKLYKLPVAMRQERIETLLKQMDLWEKKDIATGTFSKGMKQKLAIARALIHEPKVLFLDEPTSGLDPEATKMVRDTLLDLKAEKRTIFLNTHMLDEADRICDRVGILKTKLLTVGTPEDLRESLWGKKTVFQIDAVTDGVLAAIEQLGYSNIKTDNDKIIIALKNPDEENSAIVETIIAAGGHVKNVSEIMPSLEDVYLKMVKGGQ